MGDFWTSLISIILFIAVIVVLYKLLKLILNTDEHGLLGCLSMILIIIISYYLSINITLKLDERMREYETPRISLNYINLTDDNPSIITKGRTYTGIVLATSYNWARDSYNYNYVITENLTWFSENEKVLQVNENGEIKALEMGISRVYAYYDNDVDNIAFSGYLYIEDNNTEIYDKIQKGITVDDSLLKKFKFNDLYGYVDIYGKVIIPNTFHYAEEFNNGIAAVKRYEGGYSNTKRKYYYDSGPVWSNEGSAILTDYYINQKGDIIK